jgi:hypothetical protein
MSVTFTTHTENPAVSQVVSFLMQRGTGFSLSFSKGVSTWIVDYAIGDDLSPVVHFFTSPVTEYTKPVEKLPEGPQEHVEFIPPKPVEVKSWSRRPGAKNQR